MSPGGIFLRYQSDIVGFARFVVDPATKNPCETLHGHTLVDFAKAREHLVAVYDVRIFSEFEQVPYTYRFRSLDGIPRVLGDLNNGGDMFKSVVAWDRNKTVTTSHSYPTLSADPNSYSVQSLKLSIETLRTSQPKVRFQDNLVKDQLENEPDAATLSGSSIDFIDLTGDTEEEDNGKTYDDDVDSEDGCHQNYTPDIFEESVDQFELERIAEEKEKARKKKSQHIRTTNLSNRTPDATRARELRRPSSLPVTPLKETKRSLQYLSPAEFITQRLNKKRRNSTSSIERCTSRRADVRHSSTSSNPLQNEQSRSNESFLCETEGSHRRSRSITATEQDSKVTGSLSYLQNGNSGEDLDAETSLVMPSELEQRETDHSSASEEVNCTTALSGATLQVSASSMDHCLLPDIGKRPYQFKHRKPAKPSSIGVRKQAALDMSRRSFQKNPFKDSKFCCNNGCHSSVNEDYAARQYRRFLAMDRADRKQALKLMYNKDMNQFWFDGQPVCSRFMVSLSFSNQLQSAVKGTEKAGASSSIMACPREVKKTTKKDQIMIYLKDVAGTLGDALPTKGQFNLPLLTKKQVYERFLKSKAPELGMEPVSFNYFCDVWKKECSEFKAHRHHGFAVCSVCEKLRSNLANCQSTALEVTIRAQMDAHYRLMAAERRGYAERIDLTKKFPEMYMSIIVDGADQKGYGLPHFIFNTKDDKGHKMKIKCVGVLEHGQRKNLSLFTMTEEFESGANHVLEAIHRVLEEKKKKIGAMPEVLFVQADNCSRENKNKYFMAYFEMLVAMGVFLQVQVSFLPIGHTHTDIDQAFSAVASRLRVSNATSMERLLDAYRNCYTPRARAEMLDKVANFSALCNDSRALRKVVGITQYRFFRFLRSDTSHKSTENDSNTAGYYSTTCDVKVQLSDAWSPLDNSSQRMGFLRNVPNLQDTPATDTTPPDNVLEVNKHLESVEDRIESAEDMLSLLRLKERVYKRRIEPFHWDLNRCFEFKGDYLGVSSAETRFRNREVTSEDHAIVEKLSYPLNSFVAVRTEEGCLDPFWIAQTMRVAKEDAEGNVLKLGIRWYEAKLGSKNAFSAKYKMATFVSGSQQKFFDDHLDVRSIICQFDGLTQSGGLHVRTQKAIRQCLNLN